MNSLYGLIGEKLGHSLSKEIHRKIFEKLGVDAYYHLFEIEPAELHKVIFSLNTTKAVGVNVTIPYKNEIMKYLDQISIEAKGIGAINTIHFQNGLTTGYNTDYLGFGMMMDKFKIEVEGKKVVILGSGGAADAVLQFFLDQKAQEIYIISRNLQETSHKYAHKDVLISEYKELTKIMDKDLLVNCTPCGMYPRVQDCPLAIDFDQKASDQNSMATELVNLYKNYKVAVDLIYNPSETVFLKQAEQNGLQTINGLYMLVAQAFAAQEIWQQRKIDQKILEEVYEEMNSTKYSSQLEK